MVLIYIPSPYHYVLAKKKTLTAKLANLAILGVLDLILFWCGFYWYCLWGVKNSDEICMFVHMTGEISAKSIFVGPLEWWRTPISTWIWAESIIGCFHELCLSRHLNLCYSKFYFTNLVVPIHPLSLQVGHRTILLL